MMSFSRTSFIALSIAVASCNSQPLDIGSNGNPTAELTTLASGQLSPYTITVDSSNVYWANWGSSGPRDTSVATVPIGGGSVSVLVSGVFGANGIAVDQSRVYFVGRGNSGFGLMSVPLGGGLPAFLASGLTNGPIALGPNGVYGTGSLDDPNTTYQKTTVLSAPLIGGVAIPVVPPSSLPQTFMTYGIATDPQFVYWITVNNPALVMKAPLGGGSPTTLASLPETGGNNGLVVDAANVYFGAGNAVMKVPLGGGTPTKLASSPGIGMAMDESYIYFTDFASSGTVKKVSKTGGTAITLATGQTNPWGIAVDATSVYWCNVGSGPGFAPGATGSIMKLSPK